MPDAGAPADTGPQNFHTPEGAVRSFLSALRAKDPERLAETVALRSVHEASPKNQKLFESIIERSLSEDDLSDLANKLAGFQMVGANEAKSTGRFSITLGKPGKNGEYLRRTITLRREKAG